MFFLGGVTWIHFGMVQEKSWSGALSWTDNYDAICKILNYNEFIKL